MIRAQVTNEVVQKIRNDALEEVAREFDAMKNSGDTAASFAAYIRGMKT
jgi:hypothetical protein